MMTTTKNGKTVYLRKMQSKNAFTVPAGVRSRAKGGLLCARSRSRLPIAVRLSRPYKALSTPCLTGNSSQPRRLTPSRCRSNSADTQKPPTGGDFLVYPLGFEPRLDGVGGRNVIQLHYEYEYFFQKHLYFTIFYFLFASVYGIIFSN